MVKDAETTADDSRNISDKARDTIRQLEKRTDLRRQEVDKTTRSKTRATARRATIANCVSCQQKVDEEHFQAACMHFFCVDCLQRLFEASYGSEESWPASCCSMRLPVEENAELQGLMGGESLSTWRRLGKNTILRTASIAAKLNVLRSYRVD